MAIEVLEEVETFCCLGESGECSMEKDNIGRRVSRGHHLGGKDPGEQK
jgi:hypothetical protein